MRFGITIQGQALQLFKWVSLCFLVGMPLQKDDSVPKVEWGTVCVLC